MKTEKENNRSKKKPPKYVNVYNEILQMILDGVYVKGEKLPSEPHFAEKLGISRVTLRQALNLLKEDGLIENRQGVGNFVRKSPSHESMEIQGVEIPVYKCCTKPIDEMRIKYRINSAKEYKSYLEYLYKKPVSVVIGVDRFYYSNGVAAAYGFTSAPVEVLSLYDTDFDQEEEVKLLFEKQIYEAAHHAALELKVLRGEEFSRKEEVQSEQDLFVVLAETLYDERGDILAYTKYYYPAENVLFKVNLHNR